MKTKCWKIAALALAINALVLPFWANADAVDNWCTNYVSDYKGHLKRVTIRKDGDKVKIHAFGTGFPDDIDWGESTAEVYPDEGGHLPRFIAHFSVGATKSMLIVSPNSGGGAPHEGGLVVCDVFLKTTDGKPQRYTGQNLRTETEATKK
jgi:hypothetical protein